MPPLTYALPWIVFGVLVLARVRLPRRVAAPPPGWTGEYADMGAGVSGDLGSPAWPGTPEAPRVTVIVPARNEALNIEECLTTLTASRYPRFDIVVVDDRSEDGTGELARGLDRGNASSLQVVSGEDLPDGWLGKPWACFQGARVAEGDLLLFTDADTRHAPDLLSSAVASLLDDEADAVSLVGRQIMETFWERLVQPQIFFLLALRYPNLKEPVGPDRAGEAIANGQFILIRSNAYNGLGGHQAVRDEVVEDLRLAQRLCGAGYRLSLREAEHMLATRMYRSLRDLVEGWSKNIYVGARQSASGRAAFLGRLAPPGIVTFLLAAWVLPVVVLGLSAIGILNPRSTIWSGAAAAFGLLFWVTGNLRFGAPVRYALLYPLGAVTAAWVVVRSWTRGARVTWKGREYRVRV
jgi:chlorobactene glucosyltransferase